MLSAPNDRAMNQCGGLRVHWGGWSKPCCCCTQQSLPSARYHCSESADLFLGSHQEVKDHWLEQAAPAGLWFRSVLNVFKDTKVQVSFHTHFFINYSDNLKSCPKCLSLHLFPVFHFPLITGTLLKVSGSCTYLYSNLTATKTHFKIRSVCSAMLLLSPLSHPCRSLPPFALALLLSCLSFRWADATRDRFHINDYGLLTSNKPLLSDQCRIPPWCRTHLSWMGAEAGFELFFLKGNPWHSSLG